MSAHWLVLISLGLVLVASRSFVSTAPAPNELNPGDGSNVDNQNLDEDVKELELLKPQGKSVSIMKAHSSVFTNINGQKEEHSKTKEEVDKDGELVARMTQEVDKNGDVQPHVKTSLDIPSRNLHKVMEQAGGYNAKDIEQDKRNLFAQRAKQSDNNIEPYKSYTGLRYSPLDMAEYVYWTGDEKGVTMAIEEFLQNGLMTRDEAITFLQDIKQNLEYLQTHYNEERYRAQQAKDKLDERGNPEMSEVRQQMQDIMNKKSDIQDVPQSGSGITEDDYEELLEKLRVADLLYNEYSLEEVIYQLAKLMFTQSLTRGSAEAQDALQKFTSFLEVEAQQGRISRSLEKKVLDVLIASLSDTLTEHPELVNTARESLNSGMANDQMMPQYINDGKTVGNTNPNYVNGLVMKQHRFQNPSSNNMKQTLQNSGLQDQDKKST